MADYKQIIPWERMDEIASKCISKLFEMDDDEARDFLETEVELTDDEKNYFCIEDRFEVEDWLKDDDEDDYNPLNPWTPCDVADNDGVYRCPYSDDPTSETCRCCCGQGVDE